MTPEERAEKICDKLLEDFYSLNIYKRRELIAAQIREAVQIAVAETVQRTKEHYEYELIEAENHGRASMREEAAKAATDEAQKCSEAAKGRDPCEIEELQLEWEMGHKIAKRIRAIALEEK